MSSQTYDNENFDKSTPRSIESEQIIIGLALANPSLLETICTALEPKFFYQEKHAQIFECLQELYNLREPIELVPLMEQMKSKNYYEDGDREYIFNLAQKITGIEKTEYYLDIIIEKYRLRQIIETCRNVSEMCFENRESTEVVDLAEKSFYDIRNGKTNGDMKSLGDVVRILMSELKDKQNDTTGKYENVKSGIDSLDRVLGGFGKGHLVILAARPGVGKTSLALNIAYNIASSSRYTPHKSVAVFSLEMSNSELAQRIISSSLLIDSENLRDGTISDVQWEDMYSFYTKTRSDVKLFFADTPNVNTTDMKAKLRKVNNLGLIIIDYLQLMNGTKSTDNRVQELSEITRSIKLMAKEFEVPVILLSQLSRDIEKRNKGDKEPKLADLRDSGSIEQDADVVIFLTKPEGATDNPALANICEVNIAKNRHGQQAKFQLLWDGAHTVFRSKSNEPIPE